MNQDFLFGNALEQSQSVINTVTKINKLAIAELEKAVTLQASTIVSYVDFCLGQVKAVGEVHDPESLQSFYTNQMAALNALRQKLLDDGQALAKLGADFKNEISKLVQESATELAPKAAKAKVREAA